LSTLRATWADTTWRLFLVAEAVVDCAADFVILALLRERRSTFLAGALVCVFGAESAHFLFWIWDLGLLIRGDYCMTRQQQCANPNSQGSLFLLCQDRFSFSLCFSPFLQADADRCVGIFLGMSKWLPNMFLW
jgi:hypothetical protein